MELIGCRLRTTQRSRGEEGEQRLEDALSHLSDDWIMFRSYQSKRGEADAVLVGPDGVWVIEVKNHRVRLTVDGDQWHIDRLSTAGRPQGRQPATDRGGRPWGRQAGDAAQSLRGGSTRTIARSRYGRLWSWWPKARSSSRAEIQGWIW